MRTHLYSKLALDGIRKNKRLYIPYILTGSIMVMMYYILSFLEDSPALSRMKGGGTVRAMLPLGVGVIAIFSVIFLFYTNSFLIRQRYKEFGLYNILGMDKRNICRIMFWENGMVAGFAIISGLILGISFSKLAETGLLNILNLDVTYELSIAGGAIVKTIAMYLVVYFLLLLNSFFRVGRLKPLELLQSSRVGEKPPKVNWLFAVVGVILLSVAYYLAVSIEEPLSALVYFFVAVIMVIIATYLLFIAGSVALCKLLQKSKGYYYKANHFVSVSSMIYRMKRNGAGLASICILSTMVLVMISSTASLYIGAEDNLTTQYPYSLEMWVDYDEIDEYTESNFSMLREICGDVSSKYEEYELRSAVTSGLLQNGNLITDAPEVYNFDLDAYDHICEVKICSLEDYNRIADTPEELSDGECLIYCDGIECDFERFTVDGEAPLQVKKTLDKFIYTGSDVMVTIVPQIYVVIPELENYVKPLLSKESDSGLKLVQLRWQYAFQTKLSTDENIAVSEEMFAQLSDFSYNDIAGVRSYSVQCQDANRRDFYEMYGSLFFLGITLSVVFIFAAVLIIYYKQISEGYEDQSRFEIMQKVGMTKKEIRKSINSQVLTVFFLPLLFAGLHLAFAFPMVWRLLQLFSMQNMVLMIMVTMGSFIVFGLFYALVYRLTAGTYYNIVSGAKA